MEMIKNTADDSNTSQDWAARTTVNQFKALGLYADYCLSQLESWRRYKDSLRRRPSQKIDNAKVKSLLINSWNTERLLHLTLDQFSGPGSGFVAQWAFPQCYYAAFNSTLASFATSGFTESSHAAVRKKVANLANRGALLSELNVVVDGGLNDIEIRGLLSATEEFASARLNGSDFEEVKRHLISFFRSTRKMHLEDKKVDIKIPAKSRHGFKKSFSQDDWSKVSTALGMTSWLCLLYRKRIKSNYHDIDTFLSPSFDTRAVLHGLVSFTNVFSLINEINIVNHLGAHKLREWMPKEAEFIDRRISFIEDKVF